MNSTVNDMLVHSATKGHASKWQNHESPCQSLLLSSGKTRDRFAMPIVKLLPAAVDGSGVAAPDRLGTATEAVGVRIGDAAAVEISDGAVGAAGEIAIGVSDGTVGVGGEIAIGVSDGDGGSDGTLSGMQTLKGSATMPP